MPNLDAAELAAVPVGGQIHESLIDEIFDKSPLVRPFSDMVATSSHGNPRAEWVREDLAAANASNARIDGSSSAGLNDTRLGERLANLTQISTKTIDVSEQADAVENVGSQRELAKQLMKRSKELRRDVEANLTSRGVGVVAVHNATAGESAGIGGWIGTGQAPTNTDFGVGGADPILSGNPGGFPLTARVSGASRAISLGTIQDMVREAYLKGGELSCLMSTPGAIARISTALFASVAVAQIRTHTSQSEGNLGDVNKGGTTAQGAINVFNTNFARLDLVPNRFQPEVAVDVADLYLLDKSTWSQSFLKGYRVKDLARIGLSDRKEVRVDYTLISENEEANAIIADIDTSIPAVA